MNLSALVCRAFQGESKEKRRRTNGIHRNNFQTTKSQHPHLPNSTPYLSPLTTSPFTHHDHHHHTPTNPPSLLTTNPSQTPNSTPLATIDLPTSLQPRVLNALKADPKTVDLRAQAPHFFALGARMLELFEEEEIADVLSHVRLSYISLLEGFCDCMDVWMALTFWGTDIQGESGHNSRSCAQCAGCDGGRGRVFERVG